MSKPVRFVGRCIGISVSAGLATVGVVALRHALETPQPLKSPLPGEALLYRWRRRSIFYKVLGPEGAPPFVLLHAPEIGASAREMQYLMAPLARTYRVYAPDLLGFGLSDRPGGEYSAALYNELCQDFVREVVKAPATLVASGLSCNYAVSVASSTPERCAALVLLSPVMLQGERQPSRLRKYAEKPLVKALLYPMLSTRLAFLLMHGGRQASQADFAQFYANTHQLGAEHAVMALLAGKLSENMANRLETLRQPVLLIWSTQALEDQRMLASLRDAATLSRNREVELIQGAGLAVHEEQPETIVATIQRWQAEIASRLPAQGEAPAQVNESASQQTSRPVAVAEPVSTPQIRPERASIEAPPEQEPAIQEQMEVSQPEQASDIVELEKPSEESIATPTTRVPPIEPGEKSDPFVESEPDLPVVVAYCVKCKAKREMLNPREVTMKNGRLAVRGTCVVCGTSLNRIGGFH